MPDSLPPGERRSPVAEISRSLGLPVLSIEPLNTQEREVLRALARSLRVVADRCDEAIERGLVEHGLEACQLLAEVTDAGDRVRVLLGSRR